MAEVSKQVESPTALVTGGTAGIGRATALALARDGFFVWVHGRNAGRGNATVQAIDAAGGRAKFVAADLNDIDAIERLAETVGEVDVLVNNGGFSWFGPTPDLEPAEFDALFAAMSARPTTWWPHSPRRWQSMAVGALSTWAAWPGRSG